MSKEKRARHPFKAEETDGSPKIQAKKIRFATQSADSFSLIDGFHTSEFYTKSPVSNYQSFIALKPELLLDHWSPFLGPFLLKFMVLVHAKSIGTQVQLEY